MTKDNPNVRELALYVLTEVTDRGEYSNHVLKNVLEKYQYMEKRDRAFLSRLCEGTLEQLIRIDDVLNRFSKVPVKKMKPVIRGHPAAGRLPAVVHGQRAGRGGVQRIGEAGYPQGLLQSEGICQRGAAKHCQRKRQGITGDGNRRRLPVCAVFHAPVDREKMAGCVPGGDGGAAARCFSGTGVHLHPLQQLPDLAGGAADTGCRQKGLRQSRRALCRMPCV